MDKCENNIAVCMWVVLTSFTGEKLVLFISNGCIYPCVEYIYPFICVTILSLFMINVDQQLFTFTFFIVAAVNKHTRLLILTYDCDNDKINNKIEYILI